MQFSNWSYFPIITGIYFWRFWDRVSSSTGTLFSTYNSIGKIEVEDGIVGKEDDDHDFINLQTNESFASK